VLGETPGPAGTGWEEEVFAAASAVVAVGTVDAPNSHANVFRKSRRGKNIGISPGKEMSS
jgi:hypothetical protein